MDKHSAQQDMSSIIAGCKRGESQSFSQLISAYSGRLYGFFFRLSADKTVSDDLLSELFVKLVEKIGTFGGGNFDAWLFKVASNIWYDWLRNKLRQEKTIHEHEKIAKHQEKQQWKKQSDNPDLDRLGSELEKIDDQTRELIVLRYYSDMSFKEIAEMKSLPIGTILSKVHRGLKKLREQMEQYSYE